MSQKSIINNSCELFFVLIKYRHIKLYKNYYFLVLVVVLLLLT
jgi:hypothetical protein